MRAITVLVLVFAAWVWLFALGFIGQQFGAEVAWAVNFTLKVAIWVSVGLWVFERLR